MGCGKVKFVIGLLLMVLVHVNSDVEAKLEKPPLYNFRVRSDGKLEGEGCVSESSSTWYREAVLLLGQQRYRESAALLKLVERCGCKHYKLFQDMSVALSHVESHYMAYVSASLALGHSECLRFLTTGGSVPHCDAPELLLNYIAARDRIGQGMELSAALRLFDVYIQLACKRDAGGNIACHGQSAARAIVECWRIGQYTCSNWFSWDVMSSLLTAAVESDVRKCKRQRSQENTSTADQGVCYSIVQPWEATVFPLEHEHVVEIARLRINSLVKQNQVKFPAQVFKFSASQNNLIRVGLVVHKISGLESGLLRDFLTSPVSLAGQQASRFSFTLFSWEVSPSISLAPQDVPNAGYKGLHAIARVVGLELLNEFEAASRINSEEINILMDFMGWIPEGRQSLTLETMAFRPAPVQVSRDVHSTSGGGPIDYLLADRVALPPELAALQPDSLLLTTPSFFPNSHFFNYDFAYNWTEEPDACEWSKDAVAILGLYEYYKLDPTIFRIWAQMENFS
uniref:O-GlcNAc transferase C-terminal domain-containing protein n=1 Tax=Guillardia theta TaxID=55529 RepID=A0A7S4UUF2_GUITH|mmetsp:Transcript_8949/g.29870  ORF Transcript_8949/g.29870 Transcript_8949/m.29870 type:complete len:512 (+) Transcript_8949:100-1635(+)